MTKTVAVITGATSGLGRAAAMHLASHGYQVIGGGLGVPDPGLPFEELALDVCDDQSVHRFVATALARAGRIDALVNCAGIQLAGALEVMSIDETQRIIDTNLIGTIRLCKEVLPLMRAQGEGRIVNVSSLGGRIAFPFHSSYCASKFAVEGLTECLRFETKPFGIHVSVLAPGSFYTSIAEKSECSANAKNDTVYAGTMRHVVDINKAVCSKATDFLPFALKLEAILKSKRPKLRYFVGMQQQRVGAILRHVFPDSVMEGLVRKNFGLG
jgi:NAD(P)-dependent dehydrogenase (short-subunit alcohol dehydrogenase family)